MITNVPIPLPASFPTEPLDNIPDTYIVECKYPEYGTGFPRQVALFLLSYPAISLVQVGADKVGIKTGLGADDVLTLLRSQYPQFTKEDVLTVF